MTTMIPVMEPTLPDQPSVWRALTDHELRLANERDEHGMLTRRAMRVRQNAALDRWYLVRNTFRWKSRNGRVEDYFTVAGVERPHHGPWGVFAAFQKITQDDELAQTLTVGAHEIGMIEPISTAEARALYDRIRAKVGPEANIGPRPGTIAGRG